MIRELAEVIAVESNFLLVSTELKTGCTGCAQQNTCGAGVISKAFSDRRAEFRVHKPEGQFSPGQQIELLLPEQALTRYSLAVYLLPILVLLLIAIATGQLLLWSEGWMILSAFSGFAFSFYLLRHWLQQRDIQVAQLLSVQQID